MNKNGDKLFKFRASFDRPKDHDLLKEIFSIRNIFKQFEFLVKSQNIDTDYDLESNFYFRFLLSGKGILTLNNTQYEINSGDVIIINPEQKHDILMYDEYEVSAETCALNKKIISEFIYALKEKENKLLDLPELKDENLFTFKIQHLKSNLKIGDLIYKAITGIKDGIAPEFAKEIFRQELLYNLFSDEIKKKYSNKLSKIDSSYKRELISRIELVIEYLKDNYMQIISVEQLAQISGLSPAHFMRIFKQYKGITPYRYLVNIRLEKARELIITTNNTITSIAFHLGYSSLESFTKAFKGYFNYSPSDLLK